MIIERSIQTKQKDIENFKVEPFQNNRRCLSLRNNIFKLISPVLFLILTSLCFPQPFQRELNIISVSDAEGLLKNIFSGGHNNLEHQFIDIDGDEDLDIFYLDSDKTFGWFKNIGNKFNPEFEYSLTNTTGIIFFKLVLLC